MNYARQQRGTPRKLGGFVFVILLHVVIIYGLVTGTARRVVEIVKQPLMTKIIQEQKPPEQAPPPPPPPPKLAAPPPPFIPLPEIQVRQPPPQQNAITQVTNVKPATTEIAPVAPPAPAPKHDPVHVAPVAAASACQKPEYPAISRRMEEAGTVTLAFLVDVDGKVLDSRVEHSSGFRRLDEAARQALALCAFKPGTVDGKPEQGWARMQYTWNLN